MTGEDVERLMQFDGIVRNRLKITSAITNARLFLALQKEFGSFHDYILTFFGKNPVVHHFRTLGEIPVSSPESEAMSRDMKKRGFRFFGATICHAYLQACGFIDDHLAGCLCRKKQSSTIQMKSPRKNRKISGKRPHKPPVQQNGFRLPATRREKPAGMTIPRPQKAHLLSTGRLQTARPEMDGNPHVENRRENPRTLRTCFPENDKNRRHPPKTEWPQPAVSFRIPAGKSFPGQTQTSSQAT